MGKLRRRRNCRVFSKRETFQVIFMTFSEERVRNTIKKLSKLKTGSTQGRMDSFFKPLPGVLKRKSVNNENEVKKAIGKKKGGSGRPRK